MRLLKGHQEATRNEDEGSFPFEHVVGFFDRHDFSYTRKGQALASGFTLPAQVVDMLPEHLRTEGLGFKMVACCDGPACDLAAYLFVGLLGERSSVLEAANAWNISHRHPKVAVDKDGDVRLDMAIPARSATSGVIEDTCGRFMAGVDEFASFCATHPEVFGSRPALVGLPGYL